MKREYSITLSENGRVIIPSSFRKSLELKKGDKVKVSLSQENEIIIQSPKQSLKKLQNLIKKKSKSKSYVLDLFKMRKGNEI